MRKKARIEDDQELATCIGVSKSTVSRVLTGKLAPSNQFIAGTLRAFGVAWFHELFKVVDE